MNLPHEFTPSCQCILKCKEESLKETDGISHMDARSGLQKICSYETSRREPITLTCKDLLPNTYPTVSLWFS